MKIERLLATVAACGFLCALSTPAAADTVYMKNGRSITSASVRVEGDQVFIRLYQGEVAFPMSMVERIVEDAATEATATQVPVAAPVPDPNDPQQQAQEADPGAEGGDPSVAAAETDPPEPAPEETREYWQNRLFPLNQQLTRMDAELANLQARTGAEAEAQMGRIETQRMRVQSQVDAIVREARLLGVPAGWLR